jgi:hypothetical protein
MHLRLHSTEDTANADPTDSEKIQEILLRLTQLQRIIEGAFVSRDAVLARGNSDWPATPMPTLTELTWMTRDPSTYQEPYMRDDISPPHQGARFVPPPAPWAP